MYRALVLVFAFVIGGFFLSPAEAQESFDELSGIPVMPECTELENIQPEIRIGGNLTISLGGLELYESYLEQERDSHLLTLDGEQPFGDNLELEGCFIDEQEFRLFGRLGNTDVLLIGVAVEPDFGEPEFGGLWYGWSRGYDPEVEPDERGFFFKIF